jgi:integration host factor subunit beta
MAHVTKKEIVKQISERANLTQLRTKEIVQWTFDAIIDALVAEGRIELRNFGVFEVKRRKPRRARNPRTNEQVEVEAKNVVTFQPGKVMEEKVRQMINPPESKRKSRRSSPPTNAERDGEEGTEVPVGVGSTVNSSGRQDDLLESESSSDMPLKPR